VERPKASPEGGDPSLDFRISGRSAEHIVVEADDPVVAAGGAGRRLQDEAAVVIDIFARIEEIGGDLLFGKLHGEQVVDPAVESWDIGGPPQVEDIQMTDEVDVMLLTMGQELRHG